MTISEELMTYRERLDDELRPVLNVIIDRLCEAKDLDGATVLRSALSRWKEIDRQFN